MRLRGGFDVGGSIRLHAAGAASDCESEAVDYTGRNTRPVERLASVLLPAFSTVTAKSEANEVVRDGCSRTSG